MEENILSVCVHNSKENILHELLQLSEHYLLQERQSKDNEKD